MTQYHTLRTQYGPNYADMYVASDIVYNAIPDAVLASTNVVVSSGAAIPSNIYRVLWIDPTCLIPSSVPPPSLSSSLFFKGNTKT
jgi:hypothetical protein